jgi:hypothetical protein
MTALTKIGDLLYNMTDQYFEGKILKEEIPEKSDQYTGNCRVWELNQGVEDIIINDLKESMRFITPEIIRKRIDSIFRNIRFLFLVDAIIEDESIDEKALKTEFLNYSYSEDNKKIFIEGTGKASRNDRLLTLQDWLKEKLLAACQRIRRLRKGRLYRLLGDFSPAYMSDQSFHNIVQKSNFIHTYLFYKRN